jgi:hypothetical protein
MRVIYNFAEKQKKSTSFQKKMYFCIGLNKPTKAAFV